jgi:hypothetical protein
MMNKIDHSDSPIFVAGPDRSGTTLIYALLASHPNISMVRRTNMWRYFYGRYGDLSISDNFERCLNDMVHYNRMRHLKPNAERIRNEFWLGKPSYGRLFALFHRHNAERVGKLRWGDKSLHTEHYADKIIAEFPNAKIIHMARDPRDRYASIMKRHAESKSRPGATTGRWLFSMRVAKRNLDKYPDNYMLLRFEELASDPEETMQKVCRFIGEEFTTELLSMEGAGDYRERGGNSSFENHGRGVISTSPIGRFRKVLSDYEVRYIQLFARDFMDRFGYSLEPVQLSGVDQAKFYLEFLPVNMVRMLGWLTLSTLTIKRGERIPSFRLSTNPTH